MINKSRYPMSNKNVVSRGMSTQGLIINANDYSHLMGEEQEADSMPLAMAYVPWQCWRDLYAADEGFRRGTIFKELDKPFYGGRGTEACC